MIVATATSCSANATGHDAVMPATGNVPASSLVTSAPLETAAASASIPVYWLGHSNDSVYLYREFTTPATADDPIVSSLRAMMTRRPQDPDYFSVWNAPTRLGASISAKNVITVDISADAFGQKVDQGIAERSVAQLVYTATAAAAMSGLIDSSSAVQVSVLVDGHTGYNAFGHVALDKPLTRDSRFLAPVWIIDPANGASTKANPLKVSGQGISPTGVLQWSLASVNDGKAGSAYLSGSVTLPAGPSALGNYAFDVTPVPGSYLLSVFISEPETPGKQIGIDTKLVTVEGP
ncbi:GerMN domain-containing protein [Arthrobacter sp. GMC3]|uniref:GerMN domain-containing protein n=1 Tax=Arthrobacter sp. GMC3 TaxID=2058894 RepID=UPI001C6748E0|nr:GerMN domain-containing protein [Arthrobacter sp. GMC3]